jgi:hypothetical protein
MSFSLTGPTGPAAISAIAGLHLKQIAQAGTDATAGFLRIGGVNHDAPPLTVPVLAPKAIYSSWAVNPADSRTWTSLTLLGEVGIVSA